MKEHEGLYSLAMNGANRNDILHDESLSSEERNTRFGMNCNGYQLSKKGDWTFTQSTLVPFIEEFAGQKVSFFGPGSFC